MNDLRIFDDICLFWKPFWRYILAKSETIFYWTKLGECNHRIGHNYRIGPKFSAYPCFCDKKGVIMQQYVLVFAIKGWQ